MDDNKFKLGYWSIAAQKHLKIYTNDATNIDEFDTLDLTGKSGMFLGAIRGNSRIDNIKKIEKMANTVGIKPKELHKIILPEIEKASDGKVEIIKNTPGDIIGLQEYVFTNKEVLNISGQVFENQNPGNNEIITIETMDKTKKIPYLQSEIINLLNKDGFSEEEITRSLMLQNQFKLITKLDKLNKNNPIISNEYIWGENNDKIAMAISNIQFDERQTLKEVIEIIQAFQGVPIEKLPPIDSNLLMLAKKTGMINPTTIISSRNIKKEFGFTPNIGKSGGMNDDILDDVKLLLASIRFGENYTQYSTINKPERFLETLIRYGDIGPHSANETDYILLEKKGIVRVVEKSKPSYYGGSRSGACLELVKTDVAEEALKIIKSPEYNFDAEKKYENFNLVSNSSGYISSEEMRMSMGKSPEIVAESEEYFANILRDELL
ncbi:hypothetical protein [Clostridium botulinum]|uniref:hypothetical protein n=1 Tax=Clostridium botulinum TaxID=1491 RepID=UPI001C9AED7B|nr:hypothetical protein [Clostridium botulinum]MBY6810793.1 hypothetical protein [Clostridium botulinum]MBY6824212.1 hypothetical protein [Clostridium botulinum]MBY6834666.1 hypothetical protein [Clostridium botulinum]MBY6973378.1 hypothetical protein [Clostridium botulinum]MCS6104394.1 hypothetical protein [Clostridium botulinum]